MLVESLVEKISSSIDELGRILDQIHRLPPRAREKHLDSIQRLKDRLLLLKAQAKESNLQATDKNFKQAYLALHRLREEVQQQGLAAKKENVHPNLPSLRETRKDHEDAMKLIVDKDHRIEELTQTLFEKEELIRVTFEELHGYKRETERLSEQYGLTKDALTKLEIEYSALRSLFLRTEETGLDLQLKDQEREQCFRSAIDELHSLKQELMDAHERIAYFEQLAEVSMRKTKQVEENIRMVEMEANALNQNYRRQEGENLQRQKQIDDLTLQLSEREAKIAELETENAGLRQEGEMLEFQLEKLQKFMHEERAINYQERNRKEAEANHLENLIQKHQTEVEALGAKCELLQAKDEESSRLLQEKSKEIKELRSELEEAKTKVEEYLMMILQMETKQQQSENQLQFLQNQKKLHDEQLQRSLQLTKQLQNDIKIWKERLKTKEEQKTKVSLQAERWQREIKSMEKDRQTQLKHMESIEHDSISSKTLIIKLEEGLRQKDRELQSMRVRLLRAKIEIIHEIRQDMS